MLTLAVTKPLNFDDYRVIGSVSDLKVGDTVLYINGERESFPPQPTFAEGTVASIDTGRGGWYATLKEISGWHQMGVDKIRGVRRTPPADQGRSGTISFNS